MLCTSPQHVSSHGLTRNLTTSRRFAWKALIPELGCSGSIQNSVGHLVYGMVVNSPLLRVAEPQTTTCNLVRLCSASASHERALGFSGSSCFRFGLRSAIPPKLCCDSPQQAPLRMPVCLVVSGLFKASMLELIDQSTCLVELVLVPVLVRAALRTSSDASSRCSRICPSRGLVELVLLRAAHVVLFLSVLSQRGDFSCSLTVLCFLSL